MPQPLVTILTLVYNNGKEVLIGLEAIKRQLYKPVEHIIFDDGSTNDSVEIIEQWIKNNSYECLFIKNSSNRGICATVNHAIRIANGKYLFGIGDDAMMPVKLIDDVALLEADDEIAFVHSRAIMRFVDSAEDIPFYFKNQESRTPFIDMLTGHLNICTPTVTWRLSVFADVGGFDESLFFEDTDMFLRVLSRYKIGYIKKFSVVYYRHSKNISRTNTKQISQEIFSILKKWQHIPNYRYHLSCRHQTALYHFASYDKVYALRHLLPSLLAFWNPHLYRGLFNLFFKWEKGPL